MKIFQKKGFINHSGGLKVVLFTEKGHEPKTGNLCLSTVFINHKIQMIKIQKTYVFIIKQTEYFGKCWGVPEVQNADY